ncbi:MAG: zf-HC2 domain-containing protein [Candidatus Latescibacterota bacterium]|jgi:anti-sigma factor RsiW
MTSEEFEELLPAYLAGDLNAEQTARVEAWLARSPQAGESLEVYRDIDLFLESRREQVPPAAPFARAVFKRPMLSRARDIMVTLFSFPAISSLLLIIFGTAIFAYRNQITAWVNGKAELPASSSLGLDWVRSALMQFSGADIWVITGLYVGVTIAILLSTSLMVMRFLRD